MADKWPEFKKRYFAELDANGDGVNELLSCVQRDNVSFLFSAKELDHNNAVALRDYIKRSLQ